MAQKFIISTLIMFFCTSMAIAADQAGIKDQKQDQKKDGPSDILQKDSMQKQIMTKDQIQNHDRIRFSDRNRIGSGEAIGTHSPQHRMIENRSMPRQGN